MKDCEWLIQLGRSRVCGFRICGGRRRPSPYDTVHQQPQQVNAARFMQYCVRRDRIMERRDLRIKEKEKGLLTAEEVDAIAPLRAHGPTMMTSALTGTGTDEKDTVVLQTPDAVVLPSEGYIDVYPPKKTMTVTIVEPPADTLRSAGHGDDAIECAVCLEGITDEDHVRTTRCAHNFHSHCLEKWLMRYKPRCPLCQTNLKPDTKESNP